MLELLATPEIWISFLTLTMLEIVLGIDNVVFIAILVQHLKAKDREKARMLGLGLALLMRIGFLLGVAWIMTLTEPFITIKTVELSGKDIMMLVGGLFLLYKATGSIHEEVTHDVTESFRASKKGFFSTVLQIVFIDIVFSFDSVITAVGMTKHVPVIIAAMVVSMVVMLVASKHIADFITRFPTLKMLALSFIMMIGMFLVAEGLGLHVPKGYIYFAMAFSLGVEVLNLVARDRKKRKRR